MDKLLARLAIGWRLALCGPPALAAGVSIAVTAARQPGPLDQPVRLADAMPDHGVIIGVALVIIAACAVGWLVLARVVRPVVTATDMIRRCIEDDLAMPAGPIGKGGEISALLHMVEALRKATAAVVVTGAEKASAQSQTGAETRVALNQMAEDIENEANGAVSQVSDQTFAIIATVEQVRALAGHTGRAAQSATGAASVALANAKTATSGAERLATAISEIGARISRSSAVASRAVDAGHEARASIEALNRRVARIGAVADLIQDVAARTHRLAMNATIEAARAGDAGRGFVVVANEVKKLAGRTTQSIDEITRHIEEIRTAMETAVNAARQMESTIIDVSEGTAAIDDAIEQQGQATIEITRNVAATASAVTELVVRNQEVAGDAEQVGRYAADMFEQTNGLEGVVQQLRRAVVHSARTATGHTNRRASARYMADFGCWVDVEGDAPLSARIVDMSAGGARLAGAKTLAVGLRGILRVEGWREPVPFVTRSCHGPFAGVEFELTESGRAMLAILIEELAGESAA